MSNKYLEKIAFFDARVIGAGIGAAGGVLSSDKKDRKDSTITGGAIGGLSGNLLATKGNQLGSKISKSLSVGKDIDTQMKYNTKGRRYGSRLALVGGTLAAGYAAGKIYKATKND